jgi:hypothetical protein
MNILSACSSSINSNKNSIMTPNPTTHLLSVFKQNVIYFIFRISVIILNGIMPNVVAPFESKLRINHKLSISKTF